MAGNSPFVILPCEKMKKKSLYYENDAFLTGNYRILLLFLHF